MAEAEQTVYRSRRVLHSFSTSHLVMVLPVKEGEKPFFEFVDSTTGDALLHMSYEEMDQMYFVACGILGELDRR